MPWQKAPPSRLLSNWTKESAQKTNRVPCEDCNSYQDVSRETFWYYRSAKRIDSSLRLRRTSKNVPFSPGRTGRGGGIYHRGSGKAHAAFDHRSRIEGGAWQADEKRGPPRSLPPRRRHLL